IRLCEGASASAYTHLSARAALWFRTPNRSLAPTRSFTLSILTVPELPLLVPHFAMFPMGEPGRSIVGPFRNTESLPPVNPGDLKRGIYQQGDFHEVFSLQGCVDSARYFAFLHCICAALYPGQPRRQYRRGSRGYRS